MPAMTEALSIPLKSVSRGPLLAITRGISAMGQGTASADFLEIR